MENRFMSTIFAVAAVLAFSVVMLAQTAPPQPGAARVQAVPRTPFRFLPFRKALLNGEKISEEAKRTWKLLLVGWWFLTSSALLGLLRIILFSFSLVSVYFDFTILGVMTLGYLLLARVALRSWKLNFWGGREEPAQPAL